MRDWADNKAGKTSEGIYSVLLLHGYIRIDRETGTPLIRIKALQKERSVQEVSSWLMELYPKAWPALVGELRRIVRLNLGKDLLDNATDALGENQSKNYNRFLKKDGI